MEATIGVEPWTRGTVLERIWEETVECFNAGNFKRARASFGLFETIEAMTDTEYKHACKCDKKDCPCHD